MSQPCPDWRGLAAHRHERTAEGAEEPAGWQEALEHLDRCPACRQSAVAADPTLLFRRLPGVSLEAGDEAEAESMRQAVAAMRTARRLEPLPERAVWKRWVAAAALATAALSLGAGHGLPHAPAAAALAALAVPAIPSAEAPPPAPRFVSEPVPVVEELNRPAARVYQMDGGKNLSVVMIVDERFDV